MTEQTQPTDAEILDAADDFRSQYKHGGTTFDEFDALGFARAVLAKWGTPAGAGEVVGWMWQHEETGRTGFVDCWQVENGWQENNPRLRLVSKLHTTTQPTQAQAGAVPQHQPTPDVQAKMAVNQWDHFGDILPTLKAISRGDWYWGANSRCKYIEIRLDTRDGGCLLFDRERVRISPAQFAHQSHSVRMEPWTGIKGADHA